MATEIPETIYSIPTSDPHHNVTYVKVYDVTPQVVYVGYTPGYMGSHVYSGCVVYGTGYHYSPWYHGYYYPRPWTWGVHVGYNPWTGWSFGISFSNGPFRFTFGFGGGYGGGWWGPGGYRRPYARPYVHGGYRKTNININTGDINIGSGNRNRNIDRSRNNIYNRSENQNRLAQRPATQERRRPTTSQNRPNNVLTDRDGNVFRKDQAGNWQQREGGQWKQAQNLDRSSRPSTTPGRPYNPRLRQADRHSLRPDLPLGRLRDLLLPRLARPDRRLRAVPRVPSWSVTCNPGNAACNATRTTTAAPRDPCPAAEPDGGVRKFLVPRSSFRARQDSRRYR